MEEHEEADVIVVGAGVAGLAAAGELAAAGLHVVVLEARRRIGGRVLTVHEPGVPVALELGAEFVHGRLTVTNELAVGAGLPLVEVPGERWVGDGETLEEQDDLEDDLEDVFSRLDPDRSPDRSFADFLADSFHGERWQARRELALQFVRGFHAAEPGRAGERGLARAVAREAEIDGFRSYRFPRGYDGLVRLLADRSPRPRLGRAVTEVRWRAGEARVTARNSGGVERYSAPRGLVTLPLGVLKAAAGEAGAVRFDPPLDAKRAALAGIEVGAACRVVLRFERRVWADPALVPNAKGADTSGVSFLFTRLPGRTFPVFWTAAPGEAPLVVAWAGGPDAERLAGVSGDELARRAVDTLSELLGAPPGRLESALLGAHVHDWVGDPYSRGAYSYLAVGGLEAPAALAAPLDDTLYFAGEATDLVGDIGTVHGAIATGARAAREIIARAQQR